MSVRRIIDANANRAREALRVLEEAARFLLDDAELTGALKRGRHELTAAVRALGPLTGDRDTPGDVGTRLETDAEMHRASAGQVAAAAGKRLGEALRALEEYGKTIDTAAAARLQALRYEGYGLEQRLLAGLARRAPVGWRVCVLLTDDLCGPRGWRSVAERALMGGADCLQLREKTLPAAALLERARALRTLIDDAGSAAALVVNDRPDVALLAGADGVHLGQADLPCRAVRDLVGDRLVVGVSTSCLDEARRAADDGADYVGIGPMFPTATKQKDFLAGPETLTELAVWGELPHLAIGGITPENVGTLVEAGGRGIAVSACVCGAEDPEAVVRELGAAIVG